MSSASEIKQIKAMLPTLSSSALRELRAFTEYLTEREKKRSAFEKKVLKTEKARDAITCDSVDDAMQAIYNALDNDSNET